MDQTVALRIAKRFITLPLDKRRLYLEKMLEEGVSPANLPIPAVQGEVPTPVVPLATGAGQRQLQPADRLAPARPAGHGGLAGQLRCLA
ncbi:peptide synthase [compost metagenome]